MVVYYHYYNNYIIIIITIIHVLYVCMCDRERDREKPECKILREGQRMASDSVHIELQSHCGLMLRTLVQYERRTLNHQAISPRTISKNLNCRNENTNTLFQKMT